MARKPTRSAMFSALTVTRKLHHNATGFDQSTQSKCISYYSMRVTSPSSDCNSNDTYGYTENIHCHATLRPLENGATAEHEKPRSFGGLPHLRRIGLSQRGSLRK